MYIWLILFCLLEAVVDPLKESYNKAAVDFLISDFLKRALTKHKWTERSVNPEEDQSAEEDQSGEDRDKSLNFDR